MQPTIVLTRPLEQANRFAADLTAAHDGPLPILIAPLMGITPLVPDAPIGTPDHVIFTSANAVDQAMRLGVPTTATAWCVGPQTAAAAASLGFRTQVAKGDSAALVAMMTAAQPQGDILHLRGAHVTGRVVSALTEAGMTCSARIVYDQIRLCVPHPLTLALGDLQPLIIPLFSPRSARLLAEVGPPTAPTTLVTMSAAVAEAAASMRVMDVITVNFPDKNHMIAATLQSFDASSSRKMP